MLLKYDWFFGYTLNKRLDCSMIFLKELKIQNTVEVAMILGKIGETK